MSAASLGAYHVRGMTDSAGLPGVEIATVAVQVWNDGSVKAVLPSKTISIRSIDAKLLLEQILGVDLTNLT